MTFTTHVEILPHPELLDPQGKAVLLGLSNLNITAIEDVRVGKHIVLTIEADSMQEADALAKEACEKLLVNPIMERYSYEVTEGFRTRLPSLHGRPHNFSTSEQNKKEYLSSISALSNWQDQKP